MKIAISSEARLLCVLRGAVKWAAHEHGFPEAETDGLALAVDEAASNIIRHTYGNRPDNLLSLEVCSYPDRIEFILEDSGPQVQSESIQPRKLDDLRPGGLGTLFIQTYVDTASYDYNYDQDGPGRNRLKLVKFLPGKAPKKK